MKDYHYHLKRNFFLGFSLWILAISIPFSSVLAQVKTQVNPEIKPIHLDVFTDRKLLKEGEDINVKIWVESNLIDRANIIAFFPQRQLVLNDKIFCQNGLKKTSSCEVSLPRNSPVTFTFTARKSGKFNVFIQVSGQDKKTKNEIAERYLIQDIEVQEQPQLLSTLLSNPLLGVFIGGVLTITTTMLTTYLQNLWAKSQRRQWVLTNLPAQLEVTRKAISQGREAGFELWMDKLRVEGYYTELQQFAKQKRGQENLAERLLDIAFRLRDYEQDRKGTYQDIEEKYHALTIDLTQIISVLTQK